MIATHSGNLARGTDRYVNHLARSKAAAIAAGDWLQRSGAVQANSSDEEARSVSAIVATERAVPIYDRNSGRIMDEVLLMRGGTLPTWTPLLESHSHWSLMSVLGSVLETKRSGRLARARLVFSDDEYTEPIWRKVKNGHLRAISVGGRRVRYVDIEPKESAVIAGRRWTASTKRALRVTTQWVMAEASVVVFGADIDSTIA